MTTGEAQRAFVVLGHRAALTSDFSLNDLTGSAGRLDILARCVTSALCLSHGMRTDTRVDLVLQNQVTVRFHGAHVKRVNPDERSTGALIKHALKALEQGQNRSTPGVTVAHRGLADVLTGLNGAGFSVRALDEGGSDLRAARLEAPIAFVLSDHQDFSSTEAELLSGHASLRLGPTILQADHCIPIVHNELDRRWR
ncbi:MAG: tRNA (pseudouridine(54)-N(1))-methyltransferase TrmY [Candidatus Bipolaricaulia bacterium]